MKKNYKAQANIEFIGGFLLFMVAVAYVAFSTINSVPAYMEGADENALRLETWRVSENFLAAVESGNRIDNSKLLGFTGCAGYNYNDPASRNNYTNAKSLLNVSGSSQFRITIEQFPVAVLDAGDNNFRSGSIAIDGAQYTVQTRNTSLIFNETKLSSGAAWVPVNGNIDFGGANYTVASIDAGGMQVIFKRIKMDCGPKQQGNTANVVRYITYRGHLARVTVTLW